jgi:hypothetical protein
VELTNTASVKRLVFRVVPDDTTRLAMLKRGEADVVYSVRGALGEEIACTPVLKLSAIVLPANQRLVFVDQWKPGSLWADRRVRLAPTWRSTGRRSTRPGRWATRGRRAAKPRPSAACLVPRCAPAALPRGCG